MGWPFYLLIRVCSFLCFLLGFVKDVAKKNMAPMPSFRRRRFVASSRPASISTTTPAPPLAASYIEDEEVSPRDVDLRPCKALDVGVSVPATINLFEDEILVQETATILIEGGVEAASKVPRLEEIGATDPLRLEEDEVVVNAYDDSSVRPGRREASSFGISREASPAGRGETRCQSSRMMRGLTYWR